MIVINFEVFMVFPFFGYAMHHDILLVQCTTEYRSGQLHNFLCCETCAVRIKVTLCALSLECWLSKHAWLNPSYHHSSLFCIFFKVNKWPHVQYPHGQRNVHSHLYFSVLSEYLSGGLSWAIGSFPTARNIPRLLFCPAFSLSLLTLCNWFTSMIYA